MVKKTVSHAYFVGHSLGGGIAQALAVKLNVNHYSVEAVSFNSPGLSFGQKLYQMDHDDLIAITTNINAMGDSVSTVDPNKAAVHTLRCNGGSYFGSLDCHDITKVLCELWVYCSRDKEQAPQVPLFCENQYSVRVVNSHVGVSNKWNVVVSICVVFSYLAIAVFNSYHCILSRNDQIRMPFLGSLMMSTLLAFVLLVLLLWFPPGSVPYFQVFVGLSLVLSIVLGLRS